MTDEAGREHAVPADPDRRRALALAAWATGVAVAGVGAVRARNPSRAAALSGAPTRSAPTPTASPVAVPVSLPAQPAGTVGSTAGPAPADPDATTSVLASSSAARATALDGDDLVLHVARRASFGPTEALLGEISSTGVDAWLDQQLRPGEIDDDAVDRRLASLHDLRRSPADLRRLDRRTHLVAADLRVAAVVRAVESRRHLHEVMTDLWHDHLVASAAKGPVALYLPRYDRDAIRRHALGRYVDLLRAATTSAAMLEYLDTTGSSPPDINENHGRELLELHTVGRDAGYTEADVEGASRVLTGWTIERRDLEVVFDPARHDDRPASVLGWSTPGRTGHQAAGDLDSLLAHLAVHPATAERVATRLVTRFVADEPPAGLVASTAATYLASGTDLAVTLRHVLASDEFRSGGAPIVRRPFDLLAAHLRATSAQLDVPGLVDRLLPVVGISEPTVGPVLEDVAGRLGPLGGVVDDLVLAVDGTGDALLGGRVDRRRLTGSVDRLLLRHGQPLFAAPNPAGHPLAGHRWGSADALLRRWNQGAWLAYDRLWGITIDPDLLAGGATTAGAAIDALARRCFGTAPSATTRAGALAVMDRADGDPIGTDPAERARWLRPALGFLLSAPEAQLR